MTMDERELEKAIWTENARLALEQLRRLYDNLRLANHHLDNRIAGRMVMGMALQAAAVYGARDGGWAALAVLLASCVPLAFIVTLGLAATGTAFRGAGAAEWSTAMHLADKTSVADGLMQVIADEIDAVGSVEAANKTKAAVAGRIDRALVALVTLALAALVLGGAG